MEDQAIDGRSTPAEALPGAPQSRLRVEHLYLLPICILACLVFAWMATAGTWNVLFPGDYPQFYDAQASSLRHGRLDVPLSGINTEAFVRDGKFYGYFGIAPALPRMALDAIWPGMNGRWTRLSLILACAVNMFLAARLAIEADHLQNRDRPGAWRKLVIGLFVISASVGSTSLFMVSSASTFHEAIIWGAAFALACGYFAVRYVREEHRWLLVLMCIFGVLGFFCRASVGAGSLLLMLLLSARSIWRFCRGHQPRGRGDAAIAGSFAILAAALFIGINYAKFRTIDGMPLRLYSQYLKNPRLMRLAGGRQFHLENLPAGLCNYFSLDRLQRHNGFPWFVMTMRAQRFPRTAMVWVEPYCSIPDNEPALALFALIGIVAMVGWRGPAMSEYRLATICTFCGAAVVMALIVVSERYMHDFYPFLVLAGSAGSARIGAINKAATRRAAAEAIIVLLILSILLLSAFALVAQRVGPGSVPQAARDQFNTWTNSINAIQDRWQDRK